MFSLIITIISIALVAALALATLYYGGDSFNQGRADAEAGKVINQGQQLLGAAEIYFVKEGSWPANIQAMVTAGYLKSIPVAQAPGQAMGSALANGTPWVMPVANQPVFVLPGIETATCQRVNKRIFDIDGILPRAHTSLAAQCYGEGPTTFKVVVSKGGAALGPAAAADSAELPADEVTTAPIPSTSDESAWTVVPGTGSTGGGVGGGTPPTTSVARATFTVSQTGTPGTLNWGFSPDPQNPVSIAPLAIGGLELQIMPASMPPSEFCGVYLWQSYWSQGGAEFTSGTIACDWSLDGSASNLADVVDPVMYVNLGPWGGAAGDFYAQDKIVGLHSLAPQAATGASSYSWCVSFNTESAGDGRWTATSSTPGSCN